MAISGRESDPEANQRDVCFSVPPSPALKGFVPCTWVIKSSVTPLWLPCPKYMKEDSCLHYHNTSSVLSSFFVFFYFILLFGVRSCYIAHDHFELTSIFLISSAKMKGLLLEILWNLDFITLLGYAVFFIEISHTSPTLRVGKGH